MEKESKRIKNTERIKKIYKQRKENETNKKRGDQLSFKKL